MATAAYWMRGEAIDYVNTGLTTIPANTIVLFGSRLGIAGGDIPAGEAGALHVEGTFELPKESGTAITGGAVVYWDDENGVITTTASGNTVAGFAVSAATADAETVLVKINA